MKNRNVGRAPRIARLESIMIASLYHTKKRIMSVIAFTGGGSGGHVIPGIAVVQALTARYGCDSVWIGSRSGIERAIVAQMAPGTRYLWVPTGKLRRYLSLRNLIDAFKIPLGILAGLIHLIRVRPVLLFSKGGFVSVPPVIAAWLLRIPVITHESDADPGLATRINARFARYVCVPYMETAQRLRPSVGDRVVVTGNPVRGDLAHGDRSSAERAFDIDPNARLLLIMGGSLGSEALNRLVDASLPRLCALAHVVHQRGANNPPKGLDTSMFSRYRWAEYFGQEYGDLLTRADLVVCRAGAGTIWELAATGTAAVLVPLSEQASRGDQIRNARRYAQGGAAVVREEESLSAPDLCNLVSSLLADQALLEQMGEQARRFGAGDAVERIVDLVERIVPDSSM